MPRSLTAANSSSRKLRIESLEDRRMLATVAVGNALDIVNGDTRSIATLESTPGSDGISLREAIEAANNTAGDDEINFDASLLGSTILLNGSSLVITEALTIDATALKDNIIIDAQQQSRVIDYPVSTGNLLLSGLTIQNGKTTADSFVAGGGDPNDPHQGGAGIRFQSVGTLALARSTITGNTTSGLGANGAGVLVDPINGPSFGRLFIAGSVITDNYATMAFSSGGGIYAHAEVIIAGSTISNNISNAWGGGINSGLGSLTINNSTVSGNRTTDDNGESPGGGIGTFSDTVTLNNSTVSDNSTVNGSGGGIHSYSGDLFLTDSVVSGNSTAGSLSYGGGISGVQGTMTLTRSSIRNNSTSDYLGGGAGVRLDEGTINVVDSTISGNIAQGQSSYGGAIYTDRADVNVTNSTISGNRVLGSYADGGAIFTNRGVVTLSSSTVTNNSTVSGSSGGIGLRYNATYPGIPGSPVLQVENSIIAGNHAGNTPAGSSSDVSPNPMTTLIFSHSLIGTADGLGLTPGSGNLTGTVATPLDPQVTSLGDFGGPQLPDGTFLQTHAPLPGSPAIDAGDPSIVFSPTEFDQRGAGFVRVVNGGMISRIDIGSHESQEILAFPAGDYNRDGIADAADYTLWRATEGDTVSPGTGADGTGNGIINEADYKFWRSHYGNTTFTVAPATQAASAVAEFTTESASETVPAIGAALLPATSAAFASLVSQADPPVVRTLAEQSSSATSNNGLLALLAIDQIEQDSRESESDFSPRSTDEPTESEKDPFAIAWNALGSE